MKKTFAIIGGIVSGAFALLGLVTVIDYVINEFGYDDGYKPRLPEPRNIMGGNKSRFPDYESEHEYEND